MTDAPVVADRASGEQNGNEESERGVVGERRREEVGGRKWPSFVGSGRINDESPVLCREIA